MQINKSYQQDIASIQNALSMLTLRQSMNQDALTVGKLLEGMDEASKEIQKAALPHLGNNVNVLVK